MKCLRTNQRSSSLQAGIVCFQTTLAYCNISRESTRYRPLYHYTLDGLSWLGIFTATCPWSQLITEHFLSPLTNCQLGKDTNPTHLPNSRRRPPHPWGNLYTLTPMEHSFQNILSMLVHIHDFEFWQALMLLITYRWIDIITIHVYQCNKT